MKPETDKTKFSIYKLLRYTTDLMEAYPKAHVIPMVMFTDRKNYQERLEVIRQAYTGLHHLVSAALFDKYVDFIDLYAEVTPEEQQTLYQEIIQNEETAMLAQYIREKGKLEGRTEGRQEDIIEILELRLGNIPLEIKRWICNINDPDMLKRMLKKAVQIQEKETGFNGFFD